MALKQHSLLSILRYANDANKKNWDQLEIHSNVYLNIIYSK